MIDFHVHSTASDGTVPPEELAERGRDFTAMALTDHDNCDGCARFLAACERLGVTGRRLAGIELNVEPGAGNGEFHMLGLGIDPAAPCLADFLEEIRAGRNERNAKMLAKLNGLGIPIAAEEVGKYANGKIVARPHFARVIVEKGFAESVADAFARYVGVGASAYVTRYRPAQARAIDVIHRAGGVAVMAHPRYWTSDPDTLKAGLAHLKDLGLDGVEAEYQANASEETILHLRTAYALGLAVTAGSDFHGANKPAITLGMAVADEEAFLTPFWDALAAVRR
ncbi:MAG: PHP domain-containing protein [Kiritimatiellae bacterium]|nr:PHP domain-containing protein [Kiritimatiellia bacterium]